MKSLFAFFEWLGSLSLGRLRRSLSKRTFVLEHELQPPLKVEVLFDDVPVALLTDRQVVEMFWRSYKITALKPQLKSVIEDDESWNTKQVIFRDWYSGRKCSTFNAGRSGHVKEGRILLRDLYFEV